MTTRLVGTTYTFSLEVFLVGPDGSVPVNADATPTAEFKDSDGNVIESYTAAAISNPSTGTYTLSWNVSEAGEIDLVWSYDYSSSAYTQTESFTALVPASEPGDPNDARSVARERLRRYVRDYANLNRLFRAQEHSTDDLDLALDLTIDDFNSEMPPLGNWTISNFPSLWLLMHGGAIHLLESAGFLQARNELPYSSGGVSVRTFSHGPEYRAWIQKFEGRYYSKMKSYKMGLNLTQGWGGVPSVYRNIGSGGVWP
jgi:hypothetical protein